MDNPYTCEPEVFDVTDKAQRKMFIDYRKVLISNKIQFKETKEGRYWTITAEIKLEPGSYSTKSLLALAKADVPSKHI